MPQRSATRLLLVEDNPYLARAFRIVLETEGHWVHVCAGCFDLPKPDEAHFDLLITDYHVIGCTGVDVLRYSQRHWPQLKSILFTPLREGKPDAGTPKFDAYVDKLNPMSQLVATVSMLIVARNSSASKSTA